jgi:serine/threonine-protein phosphatase 2A regulatory subunit B'
MDNEKLPKHSKSPTRQSLKYQQIILEDLPLLRDEPMPTREALFKRKLKLCSVIFDFSDTETNVSSRDKKRQTLLELVDYVNSPAGQKIFTDDTMGDIVAMVKANLVRALPMCPPEYDPEEDEPNLEISWPHLQVVYEFFLRFIVSGEVNAKQAKKFVDQGLW